MRFPASGRGWKRFASRKPSATSLKYPETHETSKSRGSNAEAQAAGWRDRTADPRSAGATRRTTGPRGAGAHAGAGGKSAAVPHQRVSYGPGEGSERRPVRGEVRRDGDR